MAHSSRPTANPKCLCEVDLLPRVQVLGPGADYRSLGRDEQRRGETENKRIAELNKIRQQGSEVSMMLNGLVPKGEAEEAESAWLLEQLEKPVSHVLVLASGEEENETEHPEHEEIDIAALVLAQM